MKILKESRWLWLAAASGFMGILLINVLLLLFCGEDSTVYGIFSHYSLLWGVAAIIVFAAYRMKAAGHRNLWLFVLFCCLMHFFVSPYFLVSGFKPFADLASSAEMVVIWGLVPAGLGWMLGYVDLFGSGKRT